MMRLIYLATMVLCLTAVSQVAMASVTDPNIITEVVRYNPIVGTSDDTEPNIVKGGLKPGALPFTDRTVVFGEVIGLNGLDYVATCTDDKTNANYQLDVTVNKAGTLYLIIDNRVGHADNITTEAPLLGSGGTGVMPWVLDMGFTQTNYTVNISTPATVYEKSVAAGTISLGAQNDGSTRVMYVVAAAPEGWNMAPSIVGIPASINMNTFKWNVPGSIVDDGVPGTGITVAWTTESVPTGGTVTYSDSAVINPTIDFSELGNYTLKVSVSDGDKTTVQTIAVKVSISFAVQAAQRVIISNDSQYSADQTYTSTQLHVRNYYSLNTSTGVVTTRRKISYMKYDISSVKQAGKVFANTYLTWNFSTYSSNKNIYVYGIKEGLDTISLSGLTWNTAPGVQNTPAPTRGSEITIDTLDNPDISPLLLSYKPASKNTWLSTSPSVALDNFLNSDINGSIILMFITYEPQTTDFQIYDQTDSRVETETGLKGVIIRGDVNDPKWASNPNPEYGTTINLNATSQFSWTAAQAKNPDDPALITTPLNYDVYLGTTEPNLLAADYGYTTLVSGTTNTFVTLPAGLLQRNTTYYWIVDVHDISRSALPTRGFLWKFDTNNQAPSVNAGESQYIWLNNAGNPASATVNLNGTATDDGLPNPVTILWTQTSGTPEIIDPNGIIVATGVKADTQAISLALPTGSFIFRLTADDGDIQTSSDVLVYVGQTPCDAAKAKPDYIAPDGDFNSDCFVNMDDLLIFTNNWLECSSLSPCY